MIIIGITGTGSLIGQAIIKSIKVSKIPITKIVGFDYFSNTLGSYWCDDNVILPDILKKNVSEREFIEVLLVAISKYGINFLFIGLDFELGIFARNKDRILNETGCRVFVSDEKVINIGNDKFTTYLFLKENNLFYPESFINPEEALKMLKFPMIVKPRIGARSRGVLLVKDKIELGDAFIKTDNPIVQEYIGNKDEEFTCGVVFLDGVVKKVIVLRRELKDGNTSFAEYKKEYDFLNEYINNVADALKPEGAVNFQLRIDTDKKPKIFEINPRHSGTTYMRSFFGFNEIDIILAHHLNIKLKKEKQKEGFVIRFFDEFFVENKVLQL